MTLIICDYLVARNSQVQIILISSKKTNKDEESEDLSAWPELHNFPSCDSQGGQGAKNIIQTIPTVKCHTVLKKSIQLSVTNCESYHNNQ